MVLESSAASPLPVRTVAQAIGGWITRLGYVWVDGQIAELSRRPTAGTAFIVLRDPSVDISLTVTVARTLLDGIQPPLAEGARVAVHAKPDFYIPRGRLALRAVEIRQVGLGELLARIERLKGILAAEGLFAPERKLALPFLPRTVGLICGRGSAAERDVLENARRRWPAVRFEVREVPVQGMRAAAEVITALRELDADPLVDVVVIARGGGSVEDLLPFSDEALLRAVSASGTPVVSAIGHEQDSPLLDLVADLRASTPTDAGKRVVPDVAEETARIAALRTRGRQAVAGLLDREQGRLDALRSRPALAAPLRDIDRRQDEIIAWRARATRVLVACVERAGDDVRHLLARVQALSPAATLERGYAVVHHADGRVVRSTTQTAPGDDLAVRLAEGRLAVRVTATS